MDLTWFGELLGDMFAHNNTDGRFGTATLSGNMNPLINGSDNEGYIAYNANMVLNSTSSVFNFISNGNANVNSSNSKLTCNNNSNLGLNGNRVTATLSHNKNSNFQGSDSRWTASYNVNCSVTGNGATAELVKNSNCAISGHDSTVVAKNNFNLKVVGDGSNVNVRGTKYHELRRAFPEAKGGSGDAKPIVGVATNKLQIIFPGSGSNGSTSNSNSIKVSINGQDANVSGDGTVTVKDTTITCAGGGSKITISSGSNVSVTHTGTRFFVDYVDKAVIDRASYNIGIFAFTLIEKTPTKFELKLDESVATRTVSPSELLITAEKGGVKQVLKLEGPSVKILSAADNTFTIEAN